MQCRRLFHIDERVTDAVWRLAFASLGGGRHWCDGFIYEAVIFPMVDVLASKEMCIQNIDGFIRTIDGQVVANEILDLDSDKWASLLCLYFNAANYIPAESDEEFDQENMGDD